MIFYPLLYIHPYGSVSIEFTQVVHSLLFISRHMHGLVSNRMLPPVYTVIEAETKGRVVIHHRALLSSP